MCSPIGHNNTKHFLCPIRSRHPLEFLEMVRWESVPRGSFALTWKLSSRLSSRPDWLPLGLRGCDNRGVIWEKHPFNNSTYSYVTTVYSAIKDWANVFRLVYLLGSYPAFVNDSACSLVLGKPCITQPFVTASSCARRFFSNWRTKSSGTRK